MESVVVRTHDVCTMLGVSRSTIWRFEKMPDFPARVQLGPNSCGWMKADILAWLQKNKVAKTETV